MILFVKDDLIYEPKSSQQSTMHQIAKTMQQ